MKDSACQLQLKVVLHFCYAIGMAGLPQFMYTFYIRPDEQLGLTADQSMYTLGHSKLELVTLRWDWNCNVIAPNLM